MRTSTSSSGRTSTLLLWQPRLEGLLDLSFR
jgi:hypothetical protein